MSIVCSARVISVCGGWGDTLPEWLKGALSKVPLRSPRTCLQDLKRPLFDINLVQTNGVSSLIPYDVTGQIHVHCHCGDGITGEPSDSTVPRFFIACHLSSGGTIEASCFSTSIPLIVLHTQYIHQKNSALEYK